jgi:hypothetical protein
MSRIIFRISSDLQFPSFIYVSLLFVILCQAPCIRDAHRWRAAFISSTSRLLLPVDSLASPEAPLTAAAAVAHHTNSNGSAPASASASASSAAPASTLPMLEDATMHLRPNPLHFASDAARVTLERLRQSVVERIAAASEPLR